MGTMLVQQLYKKHLIPVNLQQHMLTVAAVGKFIVDHWRGPEIDKQAVISALLLHDLGNLVKFDLTENAKVVDLELHTQHWREIQQEMKNKYGYGSDAHEATMMMLEELNLSEKIIELVENMGADNLTSIADSNSLELKICQYADLRVVPYGIVPMMERLTDLRHRYSERSHWDEELFEIVVEEAQQIENTIRQHVSVDITAIPPEKISNFLLELPQFDIPTN